MDINNDYSIRVMNNIGKWLFDKESISITELAIFEKMLKNQTKSQYND